MLIKKQSSSNLLSDNMEPRGSRASTLDPANQRSLQISTCEVTSAEGQWVQQTTLHGDWGSRQQGRGADLTKPALRGVKWKCTYVR